MHAITVQRIILFLNFIIKGLSLFLVLRWATNRCTFTKSWHNQDASLFRYELHKQKGVSRRAQKSAWITTYTCYKRNYR